MRTEIEVEVFGQPLTQGDVSSLLTMINGSEPLEKAGAVVSLPTKRIGEFASLDPNLTKLILEVASVSAIGVVLKGVFDIILEWQKSRVQRIAIKVKDVSLEIPANASEEEVFSMTKRVAEIAQSLQPVLDTKTKRKKKKR